MHDKQRQGLGMGNDAGSQVAGDNDFMVRFETVKAV